MNIMSPQHLAYLISSDYARTTGGWIYNERLLVELAALGWSIQRHVLGAGFPDPSDDAIMSASRALGALPDGTLVLADQVVLSPLAGVLPVHAKRLRLAMIMHHPQVLEGSRPAAVAARMDAAERAALALMERVIATSPLTAQQMIKDYGVNPAKLTTALPGTDPQAPSPGSGSAAPHLLSLGSVIPRKRHELIVEALAGLSDLKWRLTIAGNLVMNAGQVAMIRNLIDVSGLSDRVALRGDLGGADLERLWSSTDLYVASSRHEGFGMAIAEAIARSIPVITTRSGAVGGWIDPRASVLVESDDVATMRAALRRVLTEPGLREALRQGAPLARASLPTWPQSAAIVSDVLLR